ncbi:MAG: iron ABC transporter substrate-binding protein, partial [Hyphomicrobiaceae bacterium]
MRALAASAAALALAVLIAPSPLKAQGQVTVYCSILEEQCRLAVTTFEKETGIKVQMVRRSTGETFAQIKAEASNPKADVWWGGPGDSHLQAAEEGLLEEYRSPRLSELQSWAVRHAEQSRFRTAGIYLGALGLGFNTKVRRRRGCRSRSAGPIC